MLVTGKITSNQAGVGPIQGANVFMSDKDGNQVEYPIIVSTDENGDYAIETMLHSYITVDKTGYKNLTSPITYATNYNFVIESLNPAEAPDDTIIDKVKDSVENKNLGKIILYSSIAIVLLIIAIFVYYKVIKK